MTGQCHFGFLACTEVENYQYGHSRLLSTTEQTDCRSYSNGNHTGNVIFFRLAKSISSQIKDRLQKSHDAFSTSLRQLEMRHTGRLDKIEEERLKLRKVHAPRVAKLALESTSMKDLILNGNNSGYFVQTFLTCSEVG